MSLLEPSLRLKFVAIRMFTRYMSSCYMKIAQFEFTDNLEANLIPCPLLKSFRTTLGIFQANPLGPLIVVTGDKCLPRGQRQRDVQLSPVSIHLTVNWDSGPLIAMLLNRRILLRQFGKWGCRLDVDSRPFQPWSVMLPVRDYVS